VGFEGDSIGRFLKVPEKFVAVLSVTTFWSFLREFSPISRAEI
jgi:hypothetical protein